MKDIITPRTLMGIEKLTEEAKEETNAKPKFMLVQKEIEKNGIKTMVTMIENVPKLCKTCDKEPRRNGSAYCEGCSNKFKQR